MDMSKLPRLSQSEAPPPEEPPIEVAQRAPKTAQHAPRYDALSMGEVWVAAIVGFIFVMLGRRFGSYLVAVISHKPFHTGINFVGEPNDGQEVPYAQLLGHAMINDAAMFLFGVAVLLDAVVIATTNFSPRVRRPLLSLAVLITMAATLFNLYVAIIFFKDGTLPIFSLLAVALGGYAASIQWSMLRMQPAAPRA